MASTFAKFKDGLKDGLSRLTGSGPDATQAVVRKCEDCVSESLFTTDWQLIDDLCNSINQGDIRCSCSGPFHVRRACLQPCDHCLNSNSGSESTLMSRRFEHAAQQRDVRGSKGHHGVYDANLTTASAEGVCWRSASADCMPQPQCVLLCWYNRPVVPSFSRKHQQHQQMQSCTLERWREHLAAFYDVLGCTVSRSCMPIALRQVSCVQCQQQGCTGCAAQTDGTA